MAQPQYDLNIRDYLRIFRKRKIVIIITFFLTTIWSLIFLYMQPKIYKSSTTVKILERKSIAGLLTEWIVYDPADLMASQTKMITGFPIMRKVATRLGKIEENTPSAKSDRIVVNLQGKVDAETIGTTNIIKITATDESPHAAMDLANTVAQVYVDENLAEKRKQSSTARTFIEEQLGKLEARLRAGEEKLKGYSKEASNIQLIAPYQEKLVSLEFELKSLLQKYTDKHPKVARLQQEVNELESQLQNFSGTDLKYAGLLREVEVNRKLYAMLKEKLEEARITEAQKVADVSIVDPAVLPLAPVTPPKGTSILVSAMAGIVMGIALAFLIETMDTSVGTIADVERLLKLPILGVIPSSARLQAEGINFLSKMKHRIFGSPKKPLNERLARLVSHFDPTSAIADAYRNIRTNLKLEASQKAILITSAGPGEGKTTILINLGLTYAQKGLKTLLVATDLRRPLIARTFGISRDPGINEVVTGAVPLDDALRNVSDIMLGDMNLTDVMKSPGLGDIWILTSGHRIFNPAELLESKEFSKLLDELKTKFDIILLDSPPVLSITDSSLLAPKVDCVILCYEIGKTARQALLRAKTQLEMTGTNIAGVILNHIAPQTETPETYSYAAGYGYHYSDKGPKDTDLEDTPTSEG